MVIQRYLKRFNSTFLQFVYQAGIVFFPLLLYQPLCL
jgi:hypothetical protein